MSHVEFAVIISLIEGSNIRFAEKVSESSLSSLTMKLFHFISFLNFQIEPSSKTRNLNVKPLRLKSSSSCEVIKQRDLARFLSYTDNRLDEAFMNGPSLNGFGSEQLRSTKLLLFLHISRSGFLVELFQFEIFKNRYRWDHFSMKFR